MTFMGWLGISAGKGIERAVSSLAEPMSASAGSAMGPLSKLIK